MFDMFNLIFIYISVLVIGLAEGTVGLIVGITEFFELTNLHDIPFNLTLFSDTPIFSMNMYELIVLFFTIFYSMFLIVLLYKATKNIIKKVFGVIKL